MKIEDQLAELLRYVDDAKIAAGELRVGGEPLPQFIRRLVAERKRLRELSDAVNTWRTAKCIGPTLPPGRHWDRPTCDGDNHIESCPVKKAMDDVLSASDHVERF